MRKIKLLQGKSRTFLMVGLAVILSGTFSCKKDIPAPKVAQSAAISQSNNVFKDGEVKLLEPMGVTATVTGTSVTIDWNAVSSTSFDDVTSTGKGTDKVYITTKVNVNVLGYQVDVTNAAGVTSTHSTDVNTTTLTIENLEAGTYSVKVKAKASIGGEASNGHNSNPSATVSFDVKAATNGVKLTTPTVTSSVVSYHGGMGNVTVSWGPITDASGYEVKVDGAVKTSATSPLSLSLAPGSHTFAVVALAPTGSSTLSNSDAGSSTVKVNDAKPIATPTVDGSVAYSAASAGTVTVNPLFIWPPNNKLVTVTFTGSGASTGTGTISYTHSEVTNATDYTVNYSSPMVNLAPGPYTVSVTAIAGGTYTDDNWVNSLAGTKTFVVLAGSLSFRLTDEYGVYTKEYILGSNFTLPVQLMASRSGTDMDGRNYTFTVTAKNGAGESVTSSTVSTVPHDQRK